MKTLLTLAITILSFGFSFGFQINHKTGEILNGSGDIIGEYTDFKVVQKRNEGNVYDIEGINYLIEIRDNCVFICDIKSSNSDRCYEGYDECTKNYIMYQVTEQEVEEEKKSSIDKESSVEGESLIIKKRVRMSEKRELKKKFKLMLEYGSKDDIKDLLTHIQSVMDDDDERVLVLDYLLDLCSS